MNNIPVFVYGSLKRGFYNHSLLGHYNSDFVGSGKTKEKYKMFSLGNFPAIKPDSSGQCVIGEVFMVNEKCLKLLDDLEATPDFYKRNTATISFGPASEMDCFIYEYQRSIEQLEQVTPISNYLIWHKK